MRLAGVEVQPWPLAVTLGLGALGSSVAVLLGLPLALLLGALLAVGGAAAVGWRPLGHPVHLPQPLRFCFVPVIGVGIGGAFTPEVAAQMPGWWPSLLAICLFVPLAHGAGYWIYRRGGLDRATAWFGAVPGGLIDSVTLGEEAGADGQMLVLLQFLRLILTIIAVPFGFAILSGRDVWAVSTAAPVPLGVGEAVVLLVAGVAGALGGRALRLPAWIITGPLVLSAVAHLAGWAEGGPPHWAVAVTQVVVGSALGARFEGLPRRALWLSARLAAVNVAVLLALAVGFALALHALVGEPVTAVMLAFAPGGLSEMSLVALSLQVSVVFVTAHHVLRIVFSVSYARVMGRWVLG